MKYTIDELEAEEAEYLRAQYEHDKAHYRVREDGLSQEDVVIKSMIDNKDKIFWRASDFLRGDCFVGYECTAIMSRVIKRYPTLCKVVRLGKYRYIALNWNDKNDLPDLVEKYKDLPRFIYQ